MYTGLLFVHVPCVMEKKLGKLMNEPHATRSEREGKLAATISKLK